MIIILFFSFAFQQMTSHWSVSRFSVDKSTLLFVQWDV